MIQFKTIFNVARYERKTLLRSWFFRIFVAIALFYMVVFNTFFFANESQSRWIYRALESYMPYINTLFINVVQAVIAVFLASDFMRRDKKLDTSEVIYTRPLSNIEYVLGKTWGIVSVFMGLTFFIMIISGVYNIVIKDVGFEPLYYILYPMIIALPTLIFILGLSFILMILVKNQAVTFLILLGYIALTLFYFKDKFYGIFDYIGFNVPLAYSDMIGFVNPELVLMQRGFYLLLGIAFIFATIRWIGRLPQSNRWNQLNLIMFIFCFVGAGALGYGYYKGKTDILETRDELRALNNTWEHLPHLHISSNELELDHLKNKIRVNANLWLNNTTIEPIDSFVIALNQGLTLTTLSSETHAISQLREGHLLIISVPETLLSNDSIQLKLQYEGEIDEKVCYLDVLDSKLLQKRSMGPIGIENMFAMVREDYVLLTPESLWYPISGVTFNKRTFLTSVPDFTHFELKVKTSPKLKAISQGKVSNEDGVFHFKNQIPQRSLSLIIGEYDKKSIKVDSLDINLFVKPGHDFYSAYFPNLKDTLSYLIKDQKNNYESNDLDLYLSFPRINLVEVPIQFQVFNRVMNAPYETVQPEMFLLPEKGASLSSADFARSLYYENRRNKQQNRDRRPIEIEANIFNDFVRRTFLTTASSSGFRPGRNSSGASQFNIDGANFSGNPLSAFPMYYDFTSAIVSDKFPMFNSIIATYLQKGFGISTFQQITGGMGDNEKANMAMRSNTLAEFVDHEEKRALLPHIISQKGSFVINGLKHEIGIYDFDDFLYYYIEDRPFQTIELDTFIKDINKDYDVDVNSFFNSINSVGNIPKFLMGTSSFYESRDEYGSLYIVRFKMTNFGEVKGLVNVSFRMGGGFGGSSGGDEERIYAFEAGETKDIQIVLFEEPRMMTVNTVVSENIPSSFSVFLRNPKELGKGDYEDSETIVSVPVQLESESELVIDNEDEGFDLHIVSSESKLKRYLEDKKEASELTYSSINPRRPPGRWNLVAHTAFYGKSVRSAWYTRSGNGDSYVTWKAPVSEKGFYDLYAYFPVTAMMGRPSRRGGGGQRGEGRRGGPEFADAGTDYHYFIYYGEEKEELEYTLPKDMEEGWTKIGTFFLEHDSVKIQLTNKSSGNRIFADAVKLVKREKQ